MSDSDNTDLELPWESCYSSPRMTKKGKKPKKDKRRKKDKSDIAMKKEGRIQKKKKKSKLKEAKMIKDHKKKNKMDNGIKLERGGDLIVTHETVGKKSTASHSQGLEQLILDGAICDFIPKKVSKKPKKKVAFKLGSGFFAAKHPMVASPSAFSSPTTQLPETNITSLIQCKGLTGPGILSEVALTAQSRSGSQDTNESQCTGDDINSQDLFITQKVFQAASVDQSSGESIDEGIAITTYDLSQQREGPTEKSRNSQLKLKAKTIWPALGKVRGNPYPEKVMPLSSSMDLVKPPDLLASHQASPGQLSTRLISTANTSTQTENFFTTELCCYLKFYQQSRLDGNLQENKALDLSLPQRKRAEPGMFSEDLTNTSALQVKGEFTVPRSQKGTPLLSKFKLGNDKDPSEHPPGSSKAGSLNSQASFSAQCKVDETPSPQSEAESKSSETTASSEDNEPNWRSGKVDLVQVRAVQMKLNESFFFKTKGEGHPPRPESPLMKLTQGREEKKNKKRC